jgi:hypothetical protein
MKIQAKNYEKIFAKDISEKGQLYKIYKELLKSTIINCLNKQCLCFDGYAKNTTGGVAYKK